jgi:hypothetical protein
MHLFDGGWNKLRETIFANQKRLGITPDYAKLTPWPEELPQWDTISDLEKKLFIKHADVYGAYLAYTDHEIGRVIQTVEDPRPARQHPDHLYQRRQRRERRRHAQRNAERVHHLQWLPVPARLAQEALSTGPAPDSEMRTKKPPLTQTSDGSYALHVTSRRSR